MGFDKLCSSRSMWISGPISFPKEPVRTQALEIESLADDEANAAVLGDLLDLTQEICSMRKVDSARNEASRAWAILFSRQRSENSLHEQHSPWEREIPSGAMLLYPDFTVTSQRFQTAL